MAKAGCLVNLLVRFVGGKGVAISLTHPLNIIFWDKLSRNAPLHTYSPQRGWKHFHSRLCRKGSFSLHTYSPQRGWKPLYASVITTDHILYIPTPLNGDGNVPALLRAAISFLYIPTPLNGDGNTKINPSSITANKLYKPIPLSGDGNNGMEMDVEGRTVLYKPIPLSGDGNSY